MVHYVTLLLAVTVLQSGKYFVFLNFPPQLKSVQHPMSQQHSREDK